MKGIKTEWNLGLLYKSPKDPQIEKDLQKIEKACATFEKKYRNTDYTANPKILAKALWDSEELSKILVGSKPWWYFALRTDLNSNDNNAGAASTKNEQRITNAANKLAFFTLRIGKIPKNVQKRYLKNRELAPYTYKLKLIFDHSRYQLSESEEQIIDLLSQTSYTMWINGQEKVLSKMVVSHKGKKMPLPEAVERISSMPEKDRAAVQKKIIECFKSNANFAESEYNAICNFKKILDERRGYRKPYSSTVLEYENEESEVENLISTITKSFDISRRFHKLHAKLLGRKKITYADRLAKIGKISKKYSFADSVEITRSALGKVDKQYAGIFDGLVKNGQIDAFPRKGKKAGAYCWGMGLLPTYVLLNHADNVRSVETLAHEMGHAIHTELSKRQPFRYQKYSMSTAETASTFFEQVATAELEEGLSKKEKIIFLHNRILGDINTIFRQVAFFNFELELHNRIRKDGQISKGDIAEIMKRHLESYLGDAVDVSHGDGYLFVYLSHARRFFYVYSYAYGQLISRVLYEKWKKDPSYAKKVEKFLSAGRSMSPKDIFKSIGIDVSDPEFFKAGLKGIESDIKKLERLTERK